MPIHNKHSVIREPIYPPRTLFQITTGSPDTIWKNGRYTDLDVSMRDTTKMLLCRGLADPTISADLQGRPLDVLMNLYWAQLCATMLIANTRSFLPRYSSRPRKWAIYSPDPQTDLASIEYLMSELSAFIIGGRGTFNDAGIEFDIRSGRDLPSADLFNSIKEDSYSTEYRGIFVRDLSMMLPEWVRYEMGLQALTHFMGAVTSFTNPVMSTLIKDASPFDYTILDEHYASHLQFIFSVDAATDTGLDVSYLTSVNKPTEFKLPIAPPSADIPFVIY